MSEQLVRKLVKTEKVPGAAALPLSETVQVGNTLYISGSLGVDPVTGLLVEGGVENEARQSLKNIDVLLSRVGVTYNNVVKTTVLLADIQDFATINKVYQEFFTSNFPARSTYQVAKLPRNGRVEIEAVAIVGEIVDRDCRSSKL